MADLQAILAKMISENHAARERFGRIASRTVSAVTQGTTDDLTDIIRDITSDEQAGEDGAESVEAGNSDGTAGVSSVEEPPI